MSTHQHEWIDDTALTDRARTYVCTTCPETARECTEGCGRAVESHLVICEPCLAKAKRWVSDVAEAIETVQFHHAEIMGLRSPRYDRDVVHTSGDRDRLPFGLDAIVEDPEDQRIAAAKHPQTAVDVLVGWADAWAETRGDERPWDALPYLVDHTLWAVQNPDTSGWDTYRDEARRVRSTVRRLLGLQPQREPAPCVHCAGTVVRDWTQDGLDDVHRCQRCGMTWPDEERVQHLNAQVVRALPQVAPDALVTIADAKRIYRGRVRPNLLDLWVHRGHLAPAVDDAGAEQRDVRGAALFRLADIDCRVGGLVAAS